MERWNHAQEKTVRDRLQQLQELDESALVDAAAQHETIDQPDRPAAGDATHPFLTPNEFRRTYSRDLGDVFTSIPDGRTFRIINYQKDAGEVSIQWFDDAPGAAREPQFEDIETMSLDQFDSRMWCNYKPETKKTVEKESEHMFTILRNVYLNDTQDALQLQSVKRAQWKNDRFHESTVGFRIISNSSKAFKALDEIATKQADGSYRCTLSQFLSYKETQGFNHKYEMHKIVENRFGPSGTIYDSPFQKSAARILSYELGIPSSGAAADSADDGRIVPMINVGSYVDGKDNMIEEKWSGYQVEELLDATGMMTIDELRQGKYGVRLYEHQQLLRQGSGNPGRPFEQISISEITKRNKNAKQITIVYETISFDTQGKERKKTGRISLYDFWQTYGTSGDYREAEASEIEAMKQSQLEQAFQQQPDRFELNEMEKIRAFVQERNWDVKDPDFAKAVDRSLDKAIEALAGTEGIVDVSNQQIPTIVISDLHARADFLLNVLEQRRGDQKTVFELLQEGKVQLVCVGNGFHSEQKANWATEDLTREMGDSLATMKLVMDLKSRFPNQFHYLRGNQDELAGSAQFFGFNAGAKKGDWIKDHYGKEGEALLNKYQAFELSLPLLFKGNRLVVSHSVPDRVLTAQQIIDRDPLASGEGFGTDLNSDARGLTWTDVGRGHFQQENISGTLQQMEMDTDQTNWIIGGPAGAGTPYRMVNERMVQMHHANQMVAAVGADGMFDPAKNIHDVLDHETKLNELDTIIEVLEQEILPEPQEESQKDEVIGKEMPGQDLEEGVLLSEREQGFLNRTFIPILQTYLQETKDLLMQYVSQGVISQEEAKKKWEGERGLFLKRNYPAKMKKLGFDESQIKEAMRLVEEAIEPTFS